MASFSIYLTSRDTPLIVLIQDRDAAEFYEYMEGREKEIESLRARLKEKDETLQELQNKLAEAEKYKSLYEQIKATAETSGGFGYKCVKCGHLYNVLNLGDSEDCPVCGCDGTIDDDIQKEVSP